MNPVKDVSAVKTTRLEENKDTAGYCLSDSHRETVEGYTFIVNTYYPLSDSPTATKRLIAVVMPSIVKTIGKRSARALPSSGRCHAALGAERR